MHLYGNIQNVPAMRDLKDRYIQAEVVNFNILVFIPFLLVKSFQLLVSFKTSSYLCIFDYSVFL